MDSSNQDIKPKKTKGLRSKRQPRPFPPLRASGTVLVPNPFYASAITTPITVNNAISDYAPSLNSEHTFSPSEMEVAEALIFLAHGVNHVSESYSKSKPKMHECTVCKKKFPSGQALGGHKRKHYEGRVIRKSAAGTRAMKKPKYK